jgi:RloB-like protein
VRPERNRILVVTEGEKTERQYLEGLASYARKTGLSVQPADVRGRGRDPMSVVRRAVHLRDEDQEAPFGPRQV